MDASTWNELYGLKGIIMALLTGVAATLISQWLLRMWPTFRRLVSKAPDISGNWTTTFQEGEKECHENVELKQVGHNVSGTIALEGEHSKYRFQGIFSNLLLVCTYESTDVRDIDRGAFALLYASDKNLKGQYIFVTNHNESDRLIPSDYKWKRI